MQGHLSLLGMSTVPLLRAYHAAHRAVGREASSSPPTTPVGGSEAPIDENFDMMSVTSWRVRSALSLGYSVRRPELQLVTRSLFRGLERWLSGAAHLDISADYENVYSPAATRPIGP